MSRAVRVFPYLIRGLLFWAMLIAPVNNVFSIKAKPTWPHRFESLSGVQSVVLFCFSDHKFSHKTQVVSAYFLPSIVPRHSVSLLFIIFSIITVYSCDPQTKATHHASLLFLFLTSCFPNWFNANSNSNYNSIIWLKVDSDLYGVLGWLIGREVGWGNQKNELLVWMWMSHVGFELTT